MNQLPDEIVELIIEAIITDYTDKDPTAEEKEKLLPRWYLVPLLRVCKIWHPLVERYLYQSISIGGKFLPSEVPGRHDEQITQDTPRTHLTQTRGQMGRELLTVLESNARLAHLVRGLQLGVGINVMTVDGDSKETQTNIRILQLCPNVEHVAIYDLCFPKCEALLGVLKEKSLISLRIILRSSVLVIPAYQNLLLRVMEATENWPRLKTLHVDQASSIDIPSTTFNANHLSRGVTFRELRTVILAGLARNEVELKVLGAICADVANFDVLLRGGTSREDEAAFKALSECLHTWSSTLTHLKIRRKHRSPPSQHLDEALSSLLCLRDLQIYDIQLDIDVLSGLPQLERLLFREFFAEMESLAKALEDLRKFPSLKLVFVQSESHDNLGARLLQDICSRRNIRLLLRDGWLDGFDTF